MKNKEIEDIIKLLNKYNLNKIKIKNKNLLIEITKTKDINKTNNNENKNINTKIIKSPLVGIFYTAPAPNKPTFVKQGDKIKKGDIICIIEAMKTLHQIKSKYSGTIKKILVKNKTPIEYNENLFLIHNV